MSGSALNLIIKIIAVILAVFLWFNVITKKQYEYDVKLPVVTIDLPPGLGLVNRLPDSMTVRVIAEGKKLLRSDWKHAGLRIRAARLESGRQNLGVNPETVALVRSEDINLVEIPNMSSIPINLDRIDSTLKPIASRLAVVPSTGYMIVAGSEKIDPIRTMVTAPITLLTRIDSIYTAARIIDDVESGVSISLALEKPPGWSVSLAHDTAHIALAVDRITTRTFNDIPLNQDRYYRGHRIISDPDRITVELIGATSILDTLKSDAITAHINLPSPDFNGYLVPQVELPRNVEISSIKPDSVRILSTQ